MSESKIYFQTARCYQPVTNPEIYSYRLKLSQLDFNMHIQSKLLHTCHEHTLQLSAGLSVHDSRLVVTMLEVSEKDEGVVALHLPIGPLKT